MNDIKVSIIVPVYNVEKYIARCLESLVNQTYANIEIILVNDGSTDSSAEICQQYEQIDDRIVVINKKNGGLSDARNIGIERSTGEYILLVDSDDYIALNCVERLVSMVDKHSADVVVCTFDFVDENDIHSDFLTDANHEEVYSSGVEYYKLILKGESRYLHCNLAWGKLYAKRLFESICYPVGKLHEDEWTTYKLLLKAKTVVYINEKLFHYYLRSGSIMRKEYTEKNLAAAEALCERYLVFKNNDMVELYLHTLNMLLGRYILDFYHLKDSNIKLMLKNKILSVYKNEFWNLTLIKHLQILLFLISPRIYKKIRKIRF